MTEGEGVDLEGKGVDLDGRRGGELLGEVEGEETVFRKSIFNKGCVWGFSCCSPNWPGTCNSPA